MLVESPRAELSESTLCPLTELVTGLEVEAQVDLGLRLVDVLAARTTRARGANMEVAIGNHQAGADFNHSGFSLLKISKKDSGARDSLRTVAESCMIPLLPRGGVQWVGLIGLREALT